MISIWRWTLALSNFILRHAAWFLFLQNCENRGLSFRERWHFFQYSGLQKYRYFSVATECKLAFFDLYILSTKTSVEAMMLNCKYSDALCCNSASALRRLLCCLKTSCIWLRISGNRLTNFIYVESSNARVIGEHK